jgi:hypothetical protein
MSQIAKSKRLRQIVLACVLTAGFAVAGAPVNEAQAWRKAQERLARELPAMKLFAANPSQPFYSRIDGQFFFGVNGRSVAIQLPAWDRDSGSARPGQTAKRAVSIGTAPFSLNTVVVQFATHNLSASPNGFASLMDGVEEGWKKTYVQQSQAGKVTGLLGLSFAELATSPAYQVLSRNLHYAGLPGKKVILRVTGGIGRESGLLKFALGFTPLYEVVTTDAIDHFYAGFELKLDRDRACAITLGNLQSPSRRPEVPFPDEQWFDQVMTRAAQILQEEFGLQRAQDEDRGQPECGKSGILTRYLEMLKKHQKGIAGLEAELGRMLSGAAPASKAINDFGRRAREAASGYLETLRSFQKAETRRGLYEEVELIVGTTEALNRVTDKYLKLARLTGAPPDRNTLNGWKGEVARRLLNAAREASVARLESEGLREILTSDSWNEAVDKAARHGQRKLNEFLDRETEQVLGFGFHDAESARRALRLRLRKEIHRQVAKLLVKVTSNEIVIELLAAPVIRWIGNDLLPRLREALRNKGNLENRLGVSVATLAEARTPLFRLACTAKLQDVRKALDRASGTLLATRFLEKDLANARDELRLAKLREARRQLEQAVHITTARFLLEKNDYEKLIAENVAESEQLLNGLRREIPPGAGDAGSGSGAGRQKLRLNKEAPPPLGLEIPFYEARVSGFRFFEGGKDAAETGQRRYGARFSRATSRFINWELRLDHQGIRTKLIQIEVIYFHPDGSEMNRHYQIDNVVPEFPGWSSLHSRGFGWEAPGNWPPGKYRVELHIRETKAAAGEFEIY